MYVHTSECACATSAYIVHVLCVSMFCVVDAYLLCVMLCAESADCLLYTSPSPRDATLSRMPSSA